MTHLQNNCNFSPNITARTNDGSVISNSSTSIIDDTSDRPPTSIRMLKQHQQHQQQQKQQQQQQRRNAAETNDVTHHVNQVPLVTSSTMATATPDAIIKAEHSSRLKPGCITNADEQAPKRPMSAYNLFFHLERRRLLDGCAERTFTTEDVAEFALQQRLNGHILKPKRPHRKTHGKIGFTDLARAIGNRWKSLDTDAKNVFHGYYEIEMSRYKKEHETWSERQSKLKEAEKVKKAAGEIVENILEQWNERHSGRVGLSADFGDTGNATRPPNHREMMMMMAESASAKIKSLNGTNSKPRTALSLDDETSPISVVPISNASSNKNGRQDHQLRSMMTSSGVGRESPMIADPSYSALNPNPHHQQYLAALRQRQRLQEIQIRRQQAMMMENDRSNGRFPPGTITGMYPPEHYENGGFHPDDMMMMSERQLIELEREQQLLERYRRRRHLPSERHLEAALAAYEQAQLMNGGSDYDMDNSPYYMADQTYDYAWQTLGPEESDDVYTDFPYDVPSYDPRYHQSIMAEEHAVMLSNAAAHEAAISASSSSSLQHEVQQSKQQQKLMMQQRANGTARGAGAMDRMISHGFGGGGAASRMSAMQKLRAKQRQQAGSGSNIASMGNHNAGMNYMMDDIATLDDESKSTYINNLINNQGREVTTPMQSNHRLRGNHPQHNNINSNNNHNMHREIMRESPFPFDDSPLNITSDVKGIPNGVAIPVSEDDDCMKNLFV
jgi:hypothetical protein